MLLNNMSTIMRDSGGINFNGTQSGNGVNGSSIGGFNTNYTNQNVYYNNNSAGLYIDVGFGDTAPQKTDYKLEDSNVLDSNLLTWLISIYVNDRLPYIRLISSTYRNDTANDVIVKEIGMIKKNGYSGVNTCNVLLTRTVLQTPVTMHPGDTVTFTVSLEI